MRDGHFGKRGHRENGEHRDREHMNKHGMKDSMDQPKSAQTFRRGRAIAFLDKLIVNRTTLHALPHNREILGVPQDYDVIGVFGIGYPEEVPNAKPRTPITSKITYLS
ncbi:hypothetical protein MHH52_14100 [Paenibacillus sp. FSL K6-0276]|uniref:hypothetical protein n=1 Tax=Paenibacillus sp. FSL K6-0276 TaxID=2921450 RepID=UPI0030EBCC2C